MTPQSYWYPLSVPTIGDEEVEAVTTVLRSHKTTMGEQVARFEEAFAQYVGADHAIMVNSGSSADLLIAFSQHLAGEVLVPAVTWPTHVWSWKMAGSTVKLIDVDGLNTTAEIIERNISPQTRGISLVHLLGAPCDMDAIEKVAFDHGLPLYEDCCEALGAKWNGLPVGSSGLAASWSFFFSHHMTTMEGGMVTTHSRRLADKLRSLRSHGWARHLGEDPYKFIDWGFNLRPTEVQAAIGLVQLGKLDTMNRRRDRNFQTILAGAQASRYIDVPAQTDDLADPSWFGVPLLTADRDKLRTHLEGEGIETRPILAGNLARQPAFRSFAAKFGDALPGADFLHHHGLYIGLHPCRSLGAERVAEVLAAW